MRRLPGLCSLALIGLAFGLATPILRAADADSAPQVRLQADQAAGRPLEELTKKAVVRDYASAWRTLAQALSENNAGLLDRDFVGIAQEEIQLRVAEQAKAGLRTRYIDRGHQLDVLFYSPEGTSVQLRDTAQFELQVFDGDKLVHSEQVTEHYVALMTPTEVRWKVRLLQAVPGQPEK